MQAEGLRTGLCTPRRDSMGSRVPTFAAVRGPPLLPPFSSLPWGPPQEAATALAQDLGGTRVSGQLGGPGRDGLGRESVRKPQRKCGWRKRPVSGLCLSA